MGIMQGIKNAVQNAEEKKDWVNSAANMVNSFVSNMNQNAGLSETEKAYKDMQAQSNELYDQQIAASKNREQELLEQQQDRTDFTIRQIEQNKAQAQKKYEDEQSKAYVDWQKQSNAYGVNAEKMATSGLTGTGYSESSQVAMYTAYQNRVASARASFELTKQDFNNAITEAQLQNNSLLAEIAYNAQQERLTLNMQKFQQNNAYLLAMMEAKQAVQSQTALFSKKVADDEWKPGAISVASNVAGNAIAGVASITEKYANAIAPGVKNFNKLTPFEDMHAKTKKSLTKAGYKGATLGEVMKAVENGILVMSEENGVTVFSRKEPINNKQKTLDSNEQKTLDSLAAAGFSGATAEEVYAAVQRGELIEYTENGVEKFMSIDTLKANLQNPASNLILPPPVYKLLYNSTLK